MERVLGTKVHIVEKAHSISRILDEAVRVIDVIVRRNYTSNEIMTPSLSSRVVKLIGTKGCAARFPWKWIVRATTSFPVPVSPVSRFSPAPNSTTTLSITA